MQQVQEGIAQIQEAYQGKKAQFVDTAGNVYDVVRDAAGLATNVVRNRAGEIFDVTKMAGQWLYSSAANYPEQVRQSTQEAADSLRATTSDFLNAAREISAAAQDAVPEFPSLDQITNRNQWLSKMALNGMYADRFLSTVEEQFQLLGEGLTAKYCAPPKLQPSLKKKYGEFRFPGGFKLILHTTECEIEGTSHRNETTMSCHKPSLEFIKYPSLYRSHHHTPTKFKSKECKFEKVHGEEDEIVLAIIDGKHDVDTGSIFASLDLSLVKAFSEDATDADLEQFYRLLPELADVEADLVEMATSAMPDAASIAQMAINSPF
jgi:hypothetical protein